MERSIHRTHAPEEGIPMRCEKCGERIDNPLEARTPSAVIIEYNPESLIYGGKGNTICGECRDELDKREKAIVFSGGTVVISQPTA